MPLFTVFLRSWQETIWIGNFSTRALAEACVARAQKCVPDPLDSGGNLPQGCDEYYYIDEVPLDTVDEDVFPFRLAGNPPAEIP